MQIAQRHTWEVSIPQARALQERLREEVIVTDEFPQIERIAGVDVGFDKAAGLTRAAVVVLNADDLTILEHAEAHLPTTFPYVPGYLSFREVPAICAALEQLQIAPDLICCDGQGFAHPRRFGVACHLGVLSGIPCVGVGKSKLIGQHAPVPEARGEWVELSHKEEIIGAVLRTRQGVKPIYVSIGHKISLQSSIRIVMSCTTRYRLPETTRLADRLASRRGNLPAS